ncbi:sigma-70 family RNA polymerase sigma factor [Ferrimicrobium sp.]|jgi:RNA polymerase sigma-70 factor (ECF subfamily)|uniref:RNA polymerase sigma factor n=1 Tax=Ferrimicrobium sp. TaxID=2926050 RepID=UPI002356F4D4|nr:sigma-70 family RNA polymerase sigma factor [Ferrimicrobium sp.]
MSTSGDATLEVVLQDLFASFSPLLRAQVNAIVKDPSIADDLVQETFLAALDHKDSLILDAERLKGWLLIVARNRAIDHLRRSHRLADINHSDLGISGDDTMALINRLTLESAIQSLTLDHQLVIKKVLIQGVPSAVVAEELGVPDGTVRSRLHYAVKLLRATLEQAHGRR